MDVPKIPLTVKNIGKPCAGKPHARFDEGGQAEWPALYSTERPPNVPVGFVLKVCG